MERRTQHVAPCPESLFSDPGLQPTASPEFSRVFGSYDGPFVIKPVTGRASQNVEYVDRTGAIDAVVERIAAKTGCIVLIEQFLSGREFCVAVAGAGPAGALAFSAVERVLEEGEMIFTSMDTKAITADRVRVMNPEDPGDAAVMDELYALAQSVYMALDLTSLVRLDIRADGRTGELHILEANPKPDLTRPGPHATAATSLIAAGLPALGWSYDDLIAFLLVERLWQLHTRRPAAVAHFMPPCVTGDALLTWLPPHVRVVLLPPQPLGLPPALGSLTDTSMSDYEAFLVEEDEASMLGADIADGPCISRKAPSLAAIEPGSVLGRLRSMVSGVSLARPKALPRAPRAGGSFVIGLAACDDLRIGSFAGGSFIASADTMSAEA